MKSNSYTHEILMLNPRRTFVRLGNTWYDTSVDFNPRKVGDRFLTGTIEEVLTYAQYTKRYPKASGESGANIIDKTSHRGYVRRVAQTKDDAGLVTRFVEYAIDHQIITYKAESDTDED